MSEDEDQDISEFDIEYRNWNKLKENMKSIGFREGAVKGKNLSMQEGFNLGYSNGFKLGEHIGMIKGIMSCRSELGLAKKEKLEFDEKTLNNLSSESCILCSEEKTSLESTQSKPIPPKNFQDFITLQEHQINEMIESLKKSNLKLYFENG